MIFIFKKENDYLFESLWLPIDIKCTKFNIKICIIFLFFIYFIFLVLFIEETVILFFEFYVYFNQILFGYMNWCCGLFIQKWGTTRNILKWLFKLFFTNIIIIKNKIFYIQFSNFYFKFFVIILLFTIPFYFGKLNLKPRLIFF